MHFIASTLPHKETGINYTPRMYCILWASQVVIPKRYQTHILQELDLMHTGIVKMKSLARSYVWWPGIDKDIERIANECEGCQITANNPKRAELHP